MLTNDRKKLSFLWRIESNGHSQISKKCFPHLQDDKPVLRVTRISLQISTEGLTVGKHRDKNTEASTSHWPGIANRLIQMDRRADSEYNEQKELARTKMVDAALASAQALEEWLLL